MNVLMNTKPVILIGNGGHANVLVNILQMNNIDVIGCVSPKFVEDFPIPYLGTDDFIFKNYMPKETFLINGIGSVGDMGNRKNAYLYYKRYGYTFLSVIHPSVILPVNCTLGEGVQLMAGAVIQPNVSIGENTLINTSASIDHDCQIGAHVHIAPGTVLSGNVCVQDETHIGTSATVIQNIKIGTKCTIGAGSVVVKNISDRTLAIGTPAREVRKK